jgi:hypothetical protein
MFPTATVSVVPVASVMAGTGLLNHDRLRAVAPVPVSATRKHDRKPYDDDWRNPHLLSSPP